MLIASACPWLDLSSLGARAVSVGQRRPCALIIVYECGGTVMDQLVQLIFSPAILSDERCLRSRSDIVEFCKGSPHVLNGTLEDLYRLNKSTYHCFLPFLIRSLSDSDLLTSTLHIVSTMVHTVRPSAQQVFARSGISPVLIGKGYPHASR